MSADQFREQCLGILTHIAACEVANRPGRLSPESSNAAAMAIH
jgi:hypothetical protein